jgi:hypothetical protein
VQAKDPQEYQKEKVYKKGTNRSSSWSKPFHGKRGYDRKLYHFTGIGGLTIRPESRTEILQQFWVRYHQMA